MTSEDDLLRQSLRDLIPDYQPPVDPFVRVTASVRRRRARRRVLLVVGTAASVAAIATAVPALVGLARPVAGQDSGSQAPAGPFRGGGSGPTGPPATSPATAPARSYPVNDGKVGTVRWKVESTSLSNQARRCLVANDPVIFNEAAWCFDDWRPGEQAAWGTVDALHPGANVTAVFGVAPEQASWVLVKLSGRSAAVKVRAVATPTDQHAKFFAVVVPLAGQEVGSVAPLAEDETVLDPIVLQSTRGRPCTVEPNLVCGSRPS